MSSATFPVSGGLAIDFYEIKEWGRMEVGLRAVIKEAQAYLVTTRTETRRENTKGWLNLLASSSTSSMLNTELINDCICDVNHRQITPDYNHRYLK
jgi:hypothetical protein